MRSIEGPEDWILSCLLLSMEEWRRFLGSNWNTSWTLKVSEIQNQRSKTRKPEAARKWPVFGTGLIDSSDFLQPTGPKGFTGRESWGLSRRLPLGFHFFQRPFQELKLEVLTICKAYIREYPHFFLVQWYPLRFGVACARLRPAPKGPMRRDDAGLYPSIRPSSHHPSIHMCLYVIVYAIHLFLEDNIFLGQAEYGHLKNNHHFFDIFLKCPYSIYITNQYLYPIIPSYYLHILI